MEIEIPLEDRSERAISLTKYDAPPLNFEQGRLLRGLGFLCLCCDGASKVFRRVIGIFIVAKRCRFLLFGRELRLRFVLRRSHVCLILRFHDIVGGDYNTHFSQRIRVWISGN